MQKREPVEVNFLPCLKPRTAPAPEEQILFQVELGGLIKSEFLPTPENIIQHIPVTYVTTNSPNLSQEPVTYLLSDAASNPSGGYCTMTGSEAQKIILLQDSDPSVNLYEPRDGLKENVLGDCGLPGVWSVVPYSVKTEVKSPLLAKDLEDKPEKKVPIKRKPPTKKKNSKLKTPNGKVSKKKKVDEEIEKGKWTEGEEKDKKNLFELTKLEDNVDQVAERLKIGCDCSDANCFDGLSPDDVFKHRLNIADLTKAEHDMYLMGVIMASIHNLEETCRHKERIRIRSCYAYQGKKVCLTAFLYLQHVTLYQMKRLRSHLKNHGVSPRIHGNRGRKPANTFSLEIYRRATNFVQKYIENHCVKTVANFTTFHSNQGVPDSGKTVGKKDRAKIPNKMTSYHLPAECTKRTVHKEYKTFCDNLKPSQKVMKYSTFTSFLKKQFPNVKFHKRDEKKHERRTTTDEEKWKLNKEEKRNKEEFGKVVDKSIQVDKSLSCGFPTKAQILINGQRLELYQESLQSFGIGHQVLVGAAQSYNVSQTLNSEEYYSV